MDFCFFPFGLGQVRARQPCLGCPGKLRLLTLIPDSGTLLEYPGQPQQMP